MNVGVVLKYKKRKFYCTIISYLLVLITLPRNKNTTKDMIVSKTNEKDYKIILYIALDLSSLCTVFHSEYYEIVEHLISHFERITHGWISLNLHARLFKLK